MADTKTEQTLADHLQDTRTTERRDRDLVVDRTPAGHDIETAA